MNRSRLTSRALVATCALLAAGTATASESHDRSGVTGADHRMSSMGRIAAQARSAAAAIFTPGTTTGGTAPASTAPRGVCVNQRHCPHFAEASPGDPLDDLWANPTGGQAETSIAVDESGRHVVVGFNDTRGFSLTPISVSGFMYSDDGGKTFTDGGQLPTTSADVFGDPEIKYLGGCNFVYASILVMPVEYLPGKPTSVQTMGIHRSRDCGHTWEGPFEVTGATNPNNFVFSDGSPVDAADKEFMDFDRRSGRLLMSWSNFTHPAIAPGGVQIATTYSDDVLTAAVPTWSPAAVVSAVEADGQSSIPRFSPDGRTAYVAWRRFPFPGTFFGYGNVTAFARSTDGGATWQAPIETSPEFFTTDQVLGNDRINTSPSMAVDKARGRGRGNVYLVYASNDSGDGADIAFQRSTDGGRSFEPAVLLNSRPGGDRSQWFPWVTVDDSTGRIFVFYYDQGVAPSGDLTQVTYTFSDDDGRSWAAPVALTDRTFHAGWGNDTGQPNIGDYNQAVAQGGKLYASFAFSYPPPGGFADGQDTPDPFSMTVPTVQVQVLPSSDHPYGATPVDLAGVATFDLGWSGHNGFIDAGESVGVTVTLRNSATNPAFATTLRDLEGRLTSPTPGVRIAEGRAAWPALRPGASAAQKEPLVLFTGKGFVPGTPIELVLTVTGGDLKRTVLRHTLFTGTPVETVLVSEDFEKPTLAATGWTSAHGAGANVVPWLLATATPSAPGFCGATSNGVFHANANDGPPGVRPSRWERLRSPVFTVPADAEYVTVEFDICYDTEDDPNLNVQAYDGVFLRVTDLTPGRAALRSVLAEAFADQFTTDDQFHYPKHLPRSGDPFYFEDMSAWAGDSQGVKHVRMRLPGMAGSTAQLRFEFTQDGFATCADVRPGHACGVLLDNVVVKSVTSAR